MAQVSAQGRQSKPINIPRYRSIVNVLRQQIISGTLNVGERLPTEDDLCRQFDVSRHTIRIALRELRGEGLIESRQGAGSTVLRRSPPLTYTSSISSLEELLQYATEVRYEVAKSGIVVADNDLANRLGCAVGQRWLRLEGVRMKPSQEDAVCWTEVFVHSDYAGIGLMIGRRSGTIYSWIEEMYGVQVGEVRQVLRVEQMPDDLCAVLACETGSPAVEISRFYRLLNGDLVEVAFNIHPADRFSYEMTLRKRGTGDSVNADSPSLT
ncbi:DNA-binding GntR family transcriptional regulator [Rhodoligotrophos appendicifer]|uniref:GntR family transcriptional regulator n=1 Tax=Rhodoligotrophos appendicifer TaxID=987056 RepID=UPI0014789230|nr:GntR family transcriptional regulator [Rhodoligotrophos appendicifer]